MGGDENQFSHGNADKMHTSNFYQACGALVVLDLKALFDN
jgi:hypothetical protein